MGARGPQKGAKYAPTIAKEQAREQLRIHVQKHVERMTQAQIANACGLMHLMLRNEDGTWRKATTEDDIEKALNGDPNMYWISTKDPNIQAYSDLLNRAHDKPKEQPQEVNLNVTDLGARLDAARLAAAKRNKESKK